MAIRTAKTRISDPTFQETLSQGRVRGSGSVSHPVSPAAAAPDHPRFSHVEPLPLPGAGHCGSARAFPAPARAEGSAPAAMSQADPELLLRELGAWDWQLCRQELPAVLPRLLISFPAGLSGGCGGGVCILRSSTVLPNLCEGERWELCEGLGAGISLETVTAFPWYYKRVMESRKSRVVHLALG